MGGEAGDGDVTGAGGAGGDGLVTVSGGSGGQDSPGGSSGSGPVGGTAPESGGAGGSPLAGAGPIELSGGYAGDAGQAGAAASGVQGGSGGGEPQGGSGTVGGHGGSTTQAGFAGSLLEGGAGGVAGAAGSTSTPTTWCEAQTPPNGVVATDYQCLDFESPFDPWIASVTDTATANTSTDLAHSPATSLRASVPSAETYEEATTAQLVHEFIGAEAIESVTVQAEFNSEGVFPLSLAWTGEVELFYIAFGSGEARLAYTYESDRGFADGYTGLVLVWMYTGGPAFMDECEVTASLSDGLWTQLELRAHSDGTLEVLVDGVVGATCSGSFDPDTVAEVHVGLNVSAATSTDYTAYFDNVVVSVQRAP